MSNLGPNGSAKPFYFFATPRYWGFHKAPNAEQDAQHLPLIQPNQDPDVAEERRRVLAADNKGAVKIINLHKIYMENPFFSTPRDVHALKGLYLTVNQGECFCVLGHNGCKYYYYCVTLHILTAIQRAKLHSLIP
jgi:hypothetical protein